MKGREEPVMPTKIFAYRKDQCRLLIWQKMVTSDNVVLITLSRLILNQFMAAGSRYSITSFSISLFHHI